MVQVGTTEDQGLYNKPSAAVHPGALAAGTLPQYNETCMTNTHECWHYPVQNMTKKKKIIWQVKFLDPAT